jgi:hypothetical protein
VIRDLRTPHVHSLWHTDYVVDYNLVVEKESETHCTSRGKHCNHFLLDFVICHLPFFAYDEKKKNTNMTSPANDEGRRDRKIKLTGRTSYGRRSRGCLDEIHMMEFRIIDLRSCWKGEVNASSRIPSKLMVISGSYRFILVVMLDQKHR